MPDQGDKYLLPRPDDAKSREADRLDGQHEMFKTLLGSISCAPLPANISSVLDLGCGTGIWSCEFARSHPSAHVVGVDIASVAGSISGAERLAPDNWTFIRADIEGAWTFAPAHSFDFIFQRMLVVAVKAWPPFFSQVFSSLRPGGVFELQEGILGIFADDGTTSEHSAMMRWYDMVRDFNASRGLDPDVAKLFPGQLQDCGFDLLHDRWIKVYGDPEVAASHGLKNEVEAANKWLSALSGMVINMTEKVFNSPAQRSLAHEALEDLTQNCRSRGYHARLTMIIAQKPRETTS